jgi:hypothetical protein
MALNDFRSAVLAARARKPAPKEAVPVMHLKSREGDIVYAADASDPAGADDTPTWFALLAVAVWIAYLIYAS